jgi:hypothetical protein
MDEGLIVLAYEWTKTHILMIEVGPNEKLRGKHYML